MIVRILSQGKSFKGLAAYLTHDPDAASAERVGWTHTLNLANDHVPSAVDEMLWTARNAELLKQEAGVRAGGRATDNTVKHVSLNWAPGETPTRAHMIETTEEFLDAMKWQGHQALIVAHEDKAHAHVHLMLNAIHPETGLRLDDTFERRRAQSWALGYERENGKILCPQRLENIEEREQAPTRPMWMAFQEKETDFERDEGYCYDQNPIILEQPENPKNSNNAEWKKLKEFQRHEREAFFSGGKSEFSELRYSVYREVREEFRERWVDFYAAQKDGADPAAVAALKKELVAEQGETLGKRRDEACAELRESRNTRYRDLLDEQRDCRHELRDRQKQGLDNDALLRDADNKRAAFERPNASFRETAADYAQWRGTERDNRVGSPGAYGNERAGGRGGGNVGGSIATGLGLGLLSVFCGLADGLTGSSPGMAPRQAEPEHRTDMFDDAFAEVSRRQQSEEEDEDSERRKKQRCLGD